MAAAYTVRGISLFGVLIKAVQTCEFSGPSKYPAPSKLGFC